MATPNLFPYLMKTGSGIVINLQEILIELEEEHVIDLDDPTVGTLDE
jgi:hypothetical protein